MCRNQRKYGNWLIPGLILALLFSCQIVYPQSRQKKVTLQKVPTGDITSIRANISHSLREGLLLTRNEIITLSKEARDRNIIFYDSLKIRASKNEFTKRLYGFMIVNPDTIYKKHFSETSDANYASFSGRRIRKIEIKRLNIFGADINNPTSDNPNKIEEVLNKTHVNTNENIIRKNLIFSEGDKISALVLSENERILRQLPYISDARIIVVPVSDAEADIIIYTKDVYSLGGEVSYQGLKKGSVSLFDKNIFGMGHEFGFIIPYDSKFHDSPGFGVHYIADNIAKSFINLNVYYLNGLGERTYGFDLSRKLISSLTKYAGGISIQQMYTSEDLDTLLVPAPLKYNLQDYWLSRSFLVNKESVSRIIIGARYTNNNVFDHPLILPESFHNLQKYRIFLGSAALSIQKYSKTNLLYSYGRTEDVPYGALFKLTVGREFNEFKQRTYTAGEVSFSKLNTSLGYFYVYSGLSTYLNQNKTEQGLLSLGLNYFSNLIILGNYKIRNFVYFHYSRGFGRYSNEYLTFRNDNGFTGFKNDSVSGTQRLTVSLESVLFSPVNVIGFKFAFFGYTDFSFLAGTNEILGRGYALSSIGLGIRIRNDNLVFKTLQIRIGYFPNPPSYSNISSITLSGVQLLRPDNFESGPPSIIPYR